MQIKDAVNEQVIKEKNAKMKRNGHRFLISFFIIFIAGYFIFFTSKVWMPASYEDIDETPIGATVSGNDRNVTLISWVYDENEQVQEVILEITNSATDGIDTYKWSALERSRGYFDVETVVNAKDFVVLRIKGVHPRWTEISLRMDIKADASNDAVFNTLKFYTSKKAIKRVSELKTCTETDYRIQASDYKIDMFDRDITKLATKISKYEKTIANAETRISELEEKEEFQTDEEKSETLEQINTLQSEISDLKSKCDSAAADIRELQEKIKMQEKIKAAQKGM